MEGSVESSFVAENNVDNGEVIDKNEKETVCNGYIPKPIVKEADIGMKDSSIEAKNILPEATISNMNGIEAKESLDVEQLDDQLKKMESEEKCEEAENCTQNESNLDNVINAEEDAAKEPDVENDFTESEEKTDGLADNVVNFSASHDESIDVKDTQPDGLAEEKFDNAANSSESHDEPNDGKDSQLEKTTKTKKRTSSRHRTHRQSYEEIREILPKVEIIPKEKIPPMERPVNWFEGDLVWSLVSGHPLWPCMVSTEPVLKVYTRLKGSGSLSCRMYHVQFFGDSPEHAWVTERNVFKFSNKEEYESLVLSIAKTKMKKPPKVEISKRFLQNWNASVLEIDTAIPLSNKERLDKFTFNYDKKYPRKVQDIEASVNETETHTEEPGTSAVDKSEKINMKRSKKLNSALKLPQKYKSFQKAKLNGIGRALNAKSKKELVAVDDTLESVIKKYTAIFNYSQNAKSKQKAKMLKILQSVSNVKCTPEKPATSSTKSGSDTNKSTTPYKCLYCSDIYFSVTEMRAHNMEMHPDTESRYQSSDTIIEQSNNSISNKSPSPDMDNDVTCQDCGVTFCSKRSLGQHRRFSHHDGQSAPKSPSVTKKSDETKVVHEITSPKIECPINTARNKSRLLLYSQAKKSPICFICEKNGDTISCTSECFRSFHVACLGDYQISDPFVCKDCKLDIQMCIICNKGSTECDGLGDLKRCSVPQCGHYFHQTCLQIHNIKGVSDQAEKTVGNGSISRCPSHSCATCDSKALVEASRKGGNRIKNKNQQRSKLFKCIRCPTAYHIGDDCVAAGTVVLGGLSIKCPKHFSPVKNLPHHHPVHISWCFVCSKGGELICCASCPAAFHASCIDLDKTPEGDWNCLDCSSGVRPLYEDVVWVKLGTYRWWPGEVTHPNEVPDNIARLQHGPGEFVVRFFGSNDYFWLSKYRVFLYQEGDNIATNRHCSRGISGVFKKALQEAEVRFACISLERQRQVDVKIAKNDKKPAPYKHIKTNKPVGRVQLHTAVLSEMAKCACKRTDPHACGPESECLNRMLLYECHPEVCPTGDRCENQRFQKCQYPDTEVFKTDWGGWGLKTKVFIKKGSFVNEYVGELIDEEECKNRIEQCHEENITNFYMLTIDKDRIIDAGPKGNFSRFMNHCCDPNCETQKWSVNGDTRVGLFAIKDISPDQELTFNYNLDCLGNDKKKCVCGAYNCSGFIGERPKPQSLDGVKRERKKKRKPRKLEHIPQHDDFCFRCRQTGTLVCCDFKACLRAFCLECLHIEKPPYGKWECPCHHCDWCGRRATSFCSFCPNSFCGSHVQNQLCPSIPNRFDTCLDHNPETAEFEMAETVATVNEWVNAPFYEPKYDLGTPSNGEVVPSTSPSDYEKYRDTLPVKRNNRTIVVTPKVESDKDSSSISGQKRKRQSITQKSDKRTKKTVSD